MSLTARMLLGYAHGLRDQSQQQHHFSWEHCARILAAALIGDAV